MGFDFGFFLLYQFVYFFYCRMVIFLYLFLLFVAFIHEWAKPFLFSFDLFMWFCYALRCFSKAKKVIFRFVVLVFLRRFFCRFILFAMNFNFRFVLISV